MKTCPMCNQGKLLEKMVDYVVNGNNLGKFPAETCNRCGEQFFDEGTAQQLETIEKERGLFGLNVKSKVSYSGNALIIRVPKDIARALRITKGREIILHPEGKEKLTVELV